MVVWGLGIIPLRIHQSLSCTALEYISDLTGKKLASHTVVSLIFHAVAFLCSCWIFSSRILKPYGLSHFSSFDGKWDLNISSAVGVAVTDFLGLSSQSESPFRNPLSGRNYFNPQSAWSLTQYTLINSIQCYKSKMHICTCMNVFTQVFNSCFWFAANLLYFFFSKACFLGSCLCTMVSPKRHNILSCFIKVQHTQVIHMYKSEMLLYHHLSPTW